jgi:hypothetical protein
LADQEAVTTLRRPPVRHATVVRSDVGHTFEVFVAAIGAWWPVTQILACLARAVEPGEQAQ